MMIKLVSLLALVAVSLAAVGASAQAGWADTPQTTQVWALVNKNQLASLMLMAKQNAQLLHLRSADGRGSLFWAFEYQQPKIAAFLLEQKVDADATDKDGKTPADMFPGSDGQLRKFMAEVEALRAEVAKEFELVNVEEEEEDEEDEEEEEEEEFDDDEDEDEDEDEEEDDEDDGHEEL
eukprot:TRINITY_DN65790_c5_g1_i2.p2 TRINITY_DN65790_c5_g1~~TRINITY_DN65790_c5_g1_i2.p2  ORF type:complete len:187 (-),score=112.62 TRINITY_DN65790_c5_g1_i2:99-635(-)